MYWHGYDRMRHFLIWSAIITVGTIIGIALLLLLLA
jgi:hypothetical protein